MRILLFLIALGGAGYGGYLQFMQRTSYASYTAEQLDQLEAGQYEQTLTAKGDALDESRVAMMEIREERTRRRHAQLAFGVGGVGLLGALVLTVLGGRGRSRDEETHAPGPAGAPGLPNMTREQAAAVLGVRPDSPRAVIEAALQAQLAERNPADMVGHSPNLRQNVLQQREELTRAANVLLGRQELAFTPDSSQE